MMRRLVTVSTLLLVATVAAAGAGDDIKWERKKALDYFGIDKGIEDLEGSYEEITGKYQVTHRPRNKPKFKIGYITAVYVSWEFFCAYTKQWAELTGESNDAVESGLSDSRKLFEDRINFIVGISTRDEEYWDLSNTRLWRTSLIIGDASFDPAEIKPFEGDHPLRFKGFFLDQGNTASSYRSEAFYVGFDYPKPGTINECLKLLVEGERGRYGFEWRFKEE